MNFNDSDDIDDDETELVLDDNSDVERLEDADPNIEDDEIEVPEDVPNRQPDVTVDAAGEMGYYSDETVPFYLMAGWRCYEHDTHQILLCTRTIMGVTLSIRVKILSFS